MWRNDIRFKYMFMLSDNFARRGLIHTYGRLSDHLHIYSMVKKTHLWSPSKHGAYQQKLFPFQVFERHVMVLCRKLYSCMERWRVALISSNFNICVLLFPFVAYKYFKMVIWRHWVTHKWIRSCWGYLLMSCFVLTLGLMTMRLIMTNRIFRSKHE